MANESQFATSWTQSKPTGHNENSRWTRSGTSRRLTVLPMSPLPGKRDNMSRNLAASVRGRLKQLADATKQDFNLTLTLYELEHLLYRHPFVNTLRISCSRGRCCSRYGMTLHTDPPVMLIYWALARMMSTRRSRLSAKFARPLPKTEWCLTPIQSRGRSSAKRQVMEV